jgi:hypothetical protein
VADALSLSTVVDLGGIGITGPAASAIAAFFGNLDEEANVELEALPQPLPLPLPLPASLPETDPDPDPDLEPEPEPEPELPSGSMAEFHEAAVLAWLRMVPGLTPAQLAAVNDIMADAEYEGAELVGLTAKVRKRPSWPRSWATLSVL